MDARRARTAALRAALLGLALAPAAVPSARSDTPGSVRILTMSDPFALVLRERVSDFDALVGASLDVELTGYAELRERILLDAFQPTSRYDLIALDVGWAREAAASGVALALDDLIAAGDVQTSTFLKSALQGATVDGRIIGLPVQPHAELLFLDRDLLAETDLPVPATTDDLIAVAKRLHGAREGLSGICWNAQRGPALGQSMLHFLSAFGGRPLDAAGRPTLDTPEMRAAIRFALALLDASPPDILTMAWDQRIYAFATGRCAMSYGWTGRSLLLQRFGLDLAAGRIGVAPAPHAPGVAPVSPLGAWLLAIPSNVASDRVPLAFDALVALTSMAANRLYVRHGVGTLIHTPLVDERGLTARNPAVALMGRLEGDGELQAWMRPDIAQFQGLTEILGNEVHAVLTGAASTEQAARSAQASFAALLDE